MTSGEAHVELRILDADSIRRLTNRVESLVRGYLHDAAFAQSEGEHSLGKAFVLGGFSALSLGLVGAALVLTMWGLAGSVAVFFFAGLSAAAARNAAAKFGRAARLRGQAAGLREASEEFARMKGAA